MGPADAMDGNAMDGNAMDRKRGGLETRWTGNAVSEHVNRLSSPAAVRTHSDRDQYPWSAQPCNGVTV
ncbi:hypothetical protein GCM10009624_17390 [Gordonia sinesedis]